MDSRKGRYALDARGVRKALTVDSGVRWLVFRQDESSGRPRTGQAEPDPFFACLQNAERQTNERDSVQSERDWLSVFSQETNLL
ncbi:MAG: hypothetical protein A2147_10705 [Chloroflexi bacterium RBG_16_57_8]|nr:MAG: hypothetical protein A2147_10705 [Chloroflexi bacterium RBG_16_57_8]